jgi:hypothetical protein
LNLAALLFSIPFFGYRFCPLEAEVDEATSAQDKLSELRLAQSGLLSYLQKMHERSAL